MQTFLSRLIKRNHQRLDDCKGGQKSEDLQTQADIRHTLMTLMVAQSSLDRLNLLRVHKTVPKQIAVIGPTQVGKSAVVNFLLQEPLAQSSGQAGFTVHCQGFHVVDNADGLYTNSDHWAAAYFGDLQQANLDALDRQVLDEYALEEVVIQQADITDTVIWDTPDFDSIRSVDYRNGLLKTIALADLIVFVVSKDKYADNTVWSMMDVLADLDTEIVVLMNKTPPEHRPELQGSFLSKYRSVNGEPPQIIFIDEYRTDLMTVASNDEVENLRQQVFSQLSQKDASAVKTNTLRYIREQWNYWTSDVAGEQRLLREYQALVDQSIENTGKRYLSEYMESDRHEEVIRLALSELLVLLEIPGMAKSLSAVRRVVTWPVRSLIAKTREAPQVPKDDRNEERRLLDELGNHTITIICNSISQRETGPDANWWREVRQRIEESESAIESKYSVGLDNYHTLLQVEIDRAAQSLYQNLQEQPATLNSLRAARVTTDAAAVVLAVKSGGLGAVDLIVAPAMLSLTTMLTEGALGQYMNRVQRNLKEYQEKEVLDLFDRKLKRPLIAVGATGSHFISEQELNEAHAILESGDV